MKQKMNLKSGMFNGLPAYACALLLLAAGLVLSVLYAVTVGSAELSVGEVYRVILYELFRWGDPEQLGSGAVHDIVCRALYWLFWSGWVCPWWGQ